MKKYDNDFTAAKQAEQSAAGRHANRKWLLLAVMAVFIALLLFSAIQLSRIVLENCQSRQLHQQIRDLAVMPAAEHASQAEEKQNAVDAPAAERAEPQAQPPETAPITVDFELLCQENPDVVAWLYCPDTVISYPIVQGSDNSYYLRRLLNKKWNSAGSLFLDYRNEADFSLPNSIVYGHNMKDKSMFALLVEYKDPAFLEAHPVMYLLTPEQNYKIELLGGAVVAADDPVYKADDSREEWEMLLDKICPHGHGLAPDDRLLTMSTCTYEFQDARYLLTGVLRELAA